MHARRCPAHILHQTHPAPPACNSPLQRTADASFCSPHTLSRHHHQARETPPLSFPLRDRPFSSILDRFFLRFYIHPSLILPFHPLLSSLPPSPPRSISSINQRPTSPHHVSSASANLKLAIIPISNSFSQLANTRILFFPFHPISPSHQQYL